MLEFMDPGSGEYYKIKNWVDTFMRIPFGKHQNLPITIDDGEEKCQEFMENAKKTLDDAVYGLKMLRCKYYKWLVNGYLILNH